MKKSIIVHLILLYLCTINCAHSFEPVNYESLNLPLNKFYRFGTSNKPEVKYDRNKTNRRNINKPQENYAKVEKFSSQRIEEIDTKISTYADLSIKKISGEVAKSVDFDYKYMQSDLSLLWQGAASKSETISFAIYKLSNPDKDKPDDKIFKKVLTTMAGMSTFVGAGTGNPVLTGAALIGGNTLGIMSTDTKALNYKYSKVNDIDMIILVRKIDELQQKIVNMYYDYMCARKRYNKIAEFVEKYKNNYDLAQEESKDVIVITDAYYRSALDEQTKARGQFFEKRSKLEQLVGAEAFAEFEKLLETR